MLKFFWNGLEADPLETDRVEVAVGWTRFGLG